MGSRAGFIAHRSTNGVSGDAKEMLESGNYKLKIIEWDWTLNETAPKKKTAK